MHVLVIVGFGRVITLVLIYLETYLNLFLDHILNCENVMHLLRHDKYLDCAVSHSCSKNCSRV